MPVRNTVMDESNFIRLLYSNALLSLNGLFIHFALRNSSVEKYFAKFKCAFCPDENKTIIEKLINIESNILSRVACPNKRWVCNIREHLESGSVKIFANEPDTQITNCLVMKVSGVWETVDEIGVTFKFIESRHT